VSTTPNYFGKPSPVVLDRVFLPFLRITPSSSSSSFPYFHFQSIAEPLR
jgi:hypothetical protein